jgi:hypothetical protein
MVKGLASFERTWTRRTGTRVLAETSRVPFVGIWLARAPDMLPPSDRRDASDWPAVAPEDASDAMMSIRKLFGLAS